MTDFFCAVGKSHCTKLSLFVPWKGAWYVDAILDDSTETLSGPVVVTIGTLELRGAILPSSSGEFVLARSMRIVGGKGGWGTLTDPADYADDAGVDARAVADDAAKVAGETIGDFDPEEPTLETHFVRRIGPASAVLERSLGDGRVWWVDAQGVTHGGKRTTFEPTAGSYSVLNYSPLNRRAEIALDDPASLWVGAILTDRLSEPQTIRDLEIHVEVDKASGAGSCRAIAWTGGDDSSQSRLGRALDALLDQRDSARLYGTYRYRVIEVLDDDEKRLALQAVRPRPGLPDVLPVSPTAGIAGGVSTPNLGSVVRIAFDEGDPTMPFVAHWPSGDPENASGIARLSDMVTSGGVNCTVMFSQLSYPGGGIPGPPTPGVPGAPTIMPGVPYLCSFGDIIIPPEFPIPEVSGDPLVGYILSASEKGAVE